MDTNTAKAIGIIGGGLLGELLARVIIKDAVQLPLPPPGDTVEAAIARNRVEIQNQEARGDVRSERIAIAFSVGLLGYLAGPTLLK